MKIDLCVDTDVDAYADVEANVDVDVEVEVEFDVIFGVVCAYDRFRCASIVESFFGDCVGFFCILGLFLCWFCLLDFDNLASGFTR